MSTKCQALAWCWSNCEINHLALIGTSENGHNVDWLEPVIEAPY
ncbi:hypothetical protein [Acinetobacter nectaris]|nr:hypothetical protein [Acinetobacter nectaris]